MKTHLRITLCVFLFILIHFNLEEQITSGNEGSTKLQWINFSPYTKPGQNPNLLTKIESAQIIALLDSLKPCVEGIRTLGTITGMENIPSLVKQRGLKVIVGIWLGTDLTSKLLTAYNIPFYPVWKNVARGETVTFTMIFAGLPKSCESFDLYEEIPQSGGFLKNNIKRNKSDVYTITLS